MANDSFHIFAVFWNTSNVPTINEGHGQDRCKIHVYMQSALIFFYCTMHSRSNLKCGIANSSLKYSLTPTKSTKRASLQIHRVRIRFSHDSLDLPRPFCLYTLLLSCARREPNRDYASNEFLPLFLLTGQCYWYPNSMTNQYYLWLTSKFE